METVVFDPYFSTAKSNHDFKRVRSLSDLASLSDVLVVCCPLTDETRGSIDSGVLRLAKSGMTLVNVSRGPVVIETDLIQALSEGILAGAALDVFEDEPLPVDSGLRLIKNVVFSSHNSSNTRQAIAKASEEVLRIIEPIIQSSRSGIE
jgi:D-3-phosphoglycerate dehydrogenase